jgi:hypothetical protein
MFRAAVQAPAEVRADAENPAIPGFGCQFLATFGLESGSATGEVVTIETRYEGSRGAGCRWFHRWHHGRPAAEAKAGKNNSRESVSMSWLRCCTMRRTPISRRLSGANTSFEQLLTGGGLQLYRAQCHGEGRRNLTARSGANLGPS